MPGGFDENGSYGEFQIDLAPGRVPEREAAVFPCRDSPISEGASWAHLWWHPMLEEPIPWALPLAMATMSGV
jgi:hypothetical protein